MNRRDFLARTSAVGSLWLPGFLAPRLPNTGHRADKISRIGIELYTVRQQLAQDVEGTLAKLAAIGFKEVEFSDYPAGTAASLRRMLDRLGLQAPASHVGFRALRTEWQRSLEQAAELGQRYIVVASIPDNEHRTLDDWKRVAAAFNRAGELSKKTGIQFAYHNHNLEFAALEGQVPYDVLLGETDPKLVAVELDLYWIRKAGRDPLEYFAKWPGRFPLVHVKDMDNTPRQFFADVGTGIIDFPRIFKASKQAGIRHYFYEQDETPGDPFESARVSFDYLRKLTF